MGKKRYGKEGGVSGWRMVAWRWWLGDDGFGDGGLEMMGLGWWVVNAVLGMVDGILIIT